MFVGSFSEANRCTFMNFHMLPCKETSTHITPYCTLRPLQDPVHMIHSPFSDNLDLSFNSPSIPIRCVASVLAEKLKHWARVGNVLNYLNCLKLCVCVFWIAAGEIVDWLAITAWYSGDMEAVNMMQLDTVVCPGAVDLVFLIGGRGRCSGGRGGRSGRCWSLSVSFVFSWFQFYCHWTRTEWWLGSFHLCAWEGHGWQWFRFQGCQRGACRGRMRWSFFSWWLIRLWSGRLGNLKMMSVGSGPVSEGVKVQAGGDEICLFRILFGAQYGWFEVIYSGLQLDDFVVFLFQKFHKFGKLLFIFGCSCFHVIKVFA